MIGQRGVPATFGGVEHHVEELGSRLAARGHEVIVYARTNYVDDRRHGYRGMRVRTLPTVNSKHLDAIVHGSLSTIDAMRTGVDVVHFHALGPGLPSMLPRAFSRAKVVQTVHGRDDERSKWSPLARTVLRLAGWLSARVPDATIVVSQELATDYRNRYRRSTTYIPNGVDEPTIRPPAEITERFGLRGNDYVLFVGRMVPEKAPDLLVRAFHELPGDRRLVLAGGSSFTDAYLRDVESLAGSDPRVVMPGYVYGPVLEELYANAAAFVLPSSLEGLPLTLLEACAYGTPVVVSDIAPNLEIVGGDAPGHRVFHAGDRAGLTLALGRARAATSRARVVPMGRRGRRDRGGLRIRPAPSRVTEGAGERAYGSFARNSHGVAVVRPDERVRDRHRPEVLHPSRCEASCVDPDPEAVATCDGLVNHVPVDDRTVGVGLQVTPERPSGSRPGPAWGPPASRGP
jgi:glycosyltransferase involved in cell wall biosynthesis